MALPLLHFAAGAVVGSLATLVYKDKEALKLIEKNAAKVREKTRRTKQKMANKVADGLSCLSDKLRREARAASATARGATGGEPMENPPRIDTLPE